MNLLNTYILIDNFQDNVSLQREGSSRMSLESVMFRIM